MLCCSLNLHSRKCLAAELVDTGVQRRAHQANKCGCQPGAERLCSCGNEPGEKCKAEEDKTDSVIHQLFNPADFQQLLRAAARKKKLIDKRGDGAGIERSGGVSGREGGKGGISGIFTKAHI